MNDQKLKIRVQFAQQTHPNDELSPSQKEQNENIKPSFDWRKISVALILISLIIGFISYLIYFYSDDREQQSSTELYPVIATQENPASPVEIPFDHVDIEEVEAKTVDLSLSAGEKIVVSEPTEIPKKSKATSEENATIINPSKKSDESVLSASDSLISNTLEDQPQVIRAQLTSDIHQREPIDIIDHVWLDKDSTGQIFFFMQLRDLMGQRVNVRWHFQDQEIASVPLLIGSQNWRTYASKLLNKTKLGAWRVTLHDESGKLLSQRNFTVGKRP